MVGTPALTRDRLVSLLDYDPVSGVFTWKTRSDVHVSVSVRDAGQPAGTLKDGYIVVMIDGKQYRAHRLAYLIMTGKWPERDVDHRDLDRAHNAWRNIRPATRSQNLGNKTKYSNNTSGFKGVTWCAPSQKWRAKICCEGIDYHLGLFEMVEDAAAAYEAAAYKFFGEFARC